MLDAGRVMGILALLRPDHRPLAARENAAVSRLAPMVGSALAAAERHDGITALSSADPLTAPPNRLSLDRDIITALASPGLMAVTMLRVRDLDDALQVCERIRRDVENAAVAGERRQPGGRLTISIGVAIVRGGDSALPPEAALAAADTALYTAKEAGRNTVVVTDPVRV